MAESQCCHNCDWNLYNIIIMGVAFMCVFTAFQTCGMVENVVIEGAQKESNGTFSGSGYTSLAIIYGVFAASNWVAPSVIAIIGPKWSMVTGAVCYGLFILSFLKPITGTLYAGSVLVGIGAAIIWTAQGNFLTINSKVDTLGRNSGIFWALLQCSLLFGNLYVFFAFNGEKNITSGTRTKLFVILSSMAGLGILLFMTLRGKPTDYALVSQNEDDELTLNEDNISSTDSSREGPVAAFKNAFKLLFTREMAMLTTVFLYTGFELTFWSGVYGTSVGHTHTFKSQAKRLIGLSGMLIGVGEIIGGGSFGLLGKKTIVYGRDPIVLLGYVTHMVAFFLTFLNLPAYSPLEETSQSAYINSSESIVLICAFLFGFGDSCYNTQLYSLLGSMYPDNSAAAFAIFKFIQSLAAALGFVYSQYLLLHFQLIILVVFGTVGSYLFFRIEWNVNNIRSIDGFDS